MDEITLKKNGLVYSDNYKTVVGLDSSAEFNGIVPNGVTSVEEEAFSCCNLKKISIPDSVTYLGANLFCNSTELETVRLPATIKKLPPFLFCGCKSLKEVEMPLELEDFSEGMFAGCEVLPEIPFRAGIKTLPENVFDSCYAIKSLVIPASVTKICSNAIANCTNLETIVLPANLEVLEKDWLVNCPKLKHIRISEENKNFKTDEKNCALFKLVDGAEIPIIKLENRNENNLPGFKEPDMENSIISFDENDSETFDDTNIFNPEEEMNENNESSKTSENIENSESLNTTENVANAPEENDMDAKLKDILGQNKMYGEDDFSIMDIPEATEEEIASDKLESTISEDEKFNNEPTVSVNVPNLSEIAEKPKESIDEKLKEIMTDENNDFSISDIPIATDEELAANKLLENEEESEVENKTESKTENTSENETSNNEETENSTENATILDDSVSGVPQEESEFGEPISDKTENEENLAQVSKTTDETSAFMENIVFETQRIFQQNTGIQGEQRILFAFAENLVSTSLGNKFSASLIKLCERLAKIHKFTSIYYLYNTRLDTEKFKSQFINFMQDKDVIVACNADDIYNITDRTVAFCRFVNISLANEDVQKEAENAKNPECKPLKLIVQDNLAE